jgi:DNA-binding transcriptional MerR regulator
MPYMVHGKCTSSVEGSTFMSYSISDIARITGLKIRTVQFWADKQLLRATPLTTDAGKGNHRSFSADELLVACLVHPLSLGQKGNQGRPIGELKEAAKSIRNLVKGRFLDDAVAGDSCFMTFIWMKDHGIQSHHYYEKESSTEIAKLLTDLKQVAGRAEVICATPWVHGVLD